MHHTRALQTVKLVPQKNKHGRKARHSKQNQLHQQGKVPEAREKTRDGLGCVGCIHPGGGFWGADPACVDLETKMSKAAHSISGHDDAIERSCAVYGCLSDAKVAAVLDEATIYIQRAPDDPVAVAIKKEMQKPANETSTNDIFRLLFRTTGFEQPGRLVSSAFVEHIALAIAYFARATLPFDQAKFLLSVVLGLDEDGSPQAQSNRSFLTLLRRCRKRLTYCHGQRTGDVLEGGKVQFNNASLISAANHTMLDTLYKFALQLTEFTRSLLDELARDSRLPGRGDWSEKMHIVFSERKRAHLPLGLHAFVAPPSGSQEATPPCCSCGMHLFLIFVCDDHLKLGADSVGEFVLAEVPANTQNALHLASLIATARIAWRDRLRDIQQADDENIQKPIQTEVLRFLWDQLVLLTKNTQPHPPTRTGPAAQTHDAVTPQSAAQGVSIAVTLEMLRLSPAQRAVHEFVGAEQYDAARACVQELLEDRIALLAAAERQKVARQKALDEEKENKGTPEITARGRGWSREKLEAPAVNWDWGYLLAAYNMAVACRLTVDLTPAIPRHIAKLVTLVSQDLGHDIAEALATVTDSTRSLDINLVMCRAYTAYINEVDEALAQNKKSLDACAGMPFSPRLLDDKTKYTCMTRNVYDVLDVARDQPNEPELHERVDALLLRREEFNRHDGERRELKCLKSSLRACALLHQVLVTKKTQTRDRENDGTPSDSIICCCFLLVLLFRSLVPLECRKTILVAFCRLISGWGWGRERGHCSREKSRRWW